MESVENSPLQSSGQSGRLFQRRTCSTRCTKTAQNPQATQTTKNNGTERVAAQRKSPRNRDTMAGALRNPRDRRLSAPVAFRPEAQEVGLGVVDELFFHGIEFELALEDPGNRGGVAGDVRAAHDIGIRGRLSS